MYNSIQLFLHYCQETIRSLFISRHNLPNAVVPTITHTTNENSSLFAAYSAVHCSQLHGLWFHHFYFYFVSSSLVALVRCSTTFWHMMVPLSKEKKSSWGIIHILALTLPFSWGPSHIKIPLKLPLYSLHESTRCWD